MFLASSGLRSGKQELRSGEQKLRSVQVPVSQAVFYSGDMTHQRSQQYVIVVLSRQQSCPKYLDQGLTRCHQAPTKVHNTCEDSLLATPIILDLVIVAELCERIQVKTGIPSPRLLYSHSQVTVSSLPGSSPACVAYCMKVGREGASTYDMIGFV